MGAITVPEMLNEKLSDANYRTTQTKYIVMEYICGYRAFTFASCVTVLRDNHDSLLHTNL
jgi:hypothetical protein